MRTQLHYIFVLFIFLFVSFSTPFYAFQKNTDKFVVVLDAGHGGKDPGKHSKYGYKEKDIALKIALLVGSELEKVPGVKVVYTRKTDVFIELHDRPKIANNANADLFISIHCNAHHTEASGTETYVLDLKNSNSNFEVAKAENEVIFLEEDYEKHYEGFDPNSPASFIGISLLQEEFMEQSILLASYIEKKFVNKIKRKSRGVKQASLWVIHQTAMPSVLIETGFVTNKQEGDYLNSKKGQLEISGAIFDAIMDYKKVLDQNTTGNIFAEVVTSIDIEKNKPNENLEIPTQEFEYPNTVFKIQLAASSNKIEPKSYNFKGLKNISMEKDGKIFRYFCGNTSDYNEIKKMAEAAKSKGYRDSFIVAYQNGKRVKLSDAVNSASN